MVAGVDRICSWERVYEPEADACSMEEGEVRLGGVKRTERG